MIGDRFHLDQERRLWLALAALTILVLVLLAITPGGAPEPGFPPARQHAQQGGQP